jgi:hypothetical protein
MLRAYACIVYIHNPGSCISIKETKSGGNGRKEHKVEDFVKNSWKLNKLGMGFKRQKLIRRLDQDGANVDIDGSLHKRMKA